MLITDDVTLIGDARTTADGYMVADVRIARTGIQVYGGAEMGRPDLSAVRVYRPADEVFAADALASMAHRPVTLDHPAEAVTAANWKKLTVGQMGGEVARDGDYVRVPLVLMDQAAIDAVKGGKRQLSVGYRANIDWTAGTAPDGQAYDAVQRSIRGNHLAIVDQARAGPACRIGDSWSAPQNGGRDVADANLVTVMVDGLTINTTDQGKQAIDKLSKLLADATSAKETADKALADATTAHAVALAAKDGEIAAAKALIPDAAALDKLVADRVALADSARKVMGAAYVVAGKTAVAIKREVAAKKFGDAAVTGKDDAYVAAFFDAAMAGAGVTVDPLRQALADGTPHADAAKTVADARAAMVADLTKPRNLAVVAK